MKPILAVWSLLLSPALVFFGPANASAAEPLPKHTEKTPAELSQTPSWSKEDLEFFLHGSMSTEVAPEKVLRALIRAYPDLFPSRDLGTFGLIPDKSFGWPIGFSRSNVKHLGGMSSVGVNCAACHVDEIHAARNSSPVRLLGGTSHFDAETFFGAMAVATFRTADPVNMQRFLAEYLVENEPRAGVTAELMLTALWRQHEQKIITAISADPSGAKGLAPGALHELNASEFQMDRKSLAAGQDVSALAHSILKLFHNMRASLHIPDQPPEKVPPPSGPGRNDAFGLLSAALFGAPQPSAPVKYGVIWNLEERHWVHWDGNTQSPLGRNLLASLGLGAPLVGKHCYLDFSLVKRQTDLSERIHSPHYPFSIDHAAANRGAAHFQAKCAACHAGDESDKRLFPPSETGTDSLRAESFTPAAADRFNKFLANLETPGYAAPDRPAIRSTQKYWSPTLGGVWARSPYLHNGSVRTMAELLLPPANRARSFHRGSRVYDAAQMGFADEGFYVLDTSVPGSANTGHDYGTGLSVTEKHDLIEYLKTL